MRIEKKRYGTLTTGAVVEETSMYVQEGTFGVAEGDVRLIAVTGETGLWLLCCVTNQLPGDAVLTDEATYLQYKTSVEEF